MEVIVDLALEPSDRRFAFPASGTRSLLFRFGDTTFGGTLTSASGEVFEPGGTYLGANLGLWHAHESTIVSGATFVVWYDGDIGRGIVRSLPTQTQLPLGSG